MAGIVVSCPFLAGPTSSTRLQIYVLVLEVHPIEWWNRGNNQLVWTPERLIAAFASNPNPLDRPITTGVARIRLDPVVASGKAETRHQGHEGLL